MRAGRARPARRGPHHRDRVIAALGVAAVIWGWGIAQYPVLLPGTSLTLSTAGAPATTMDAIVVLFIAATALVVPSFALLLALQQHRLLEDDANEASPGGDASSRHQ